jgi:hypothetical protein
MLQKANPRIEKRRRAMATDRLRAVEQLIEHIEPP